MTPGTCLVGSPARERTGGGPRSRVSLPFASPRWPLCANAVRSFKITTVTDEDAAPSQTCSGGEPPAPLPVSGARFAAPPSGDSHHRPSLGAPLPGQGSAGRPGGRRPGPARPHGGPALPQSRARAPGWRPAALPPGARLRPSASVTWPRHPSCPKGSGQISRDGEGSARLPVWNTERARGSSPAS